MSIETLARGLQAKRVGTSLMARCPVHDDRDPSLSISQADDRILVHCHAGCTQQVVIEALRQQGLWNPQTGIIDSIYDYTDEGGALLYQIIRYFPKSFRQRYPDDAGGWIWKKHPRQVLYRLPEVIESTIVFVVEGERDAETLREHGFVATTNAGGANAPWLHSFTSQLAGREVILIPDNDSPGWTRAMKIAERLLGVAERVRLLPLPPSTKDISDWFAAGHGECELIEMVEGTYARSN